MQLEQVKQSAYSSEWLKTVHCASARHSASQPPGALAKPGCVLVENEGASCKAEWLCSEQDLHAGYSRAMQRTG